MASCSWNYVSLSYPTISGQINAGAGISHGIVWSYTNSSPTIASNNGSTGGGGGSGVYNVSGTVGCGHAHVYVRGYCTDGGTYAYTTSSNLGATPTCPSVPTVSTTAPTLLTITGATGGGNVSNQGYPAGSARGVCWGTSINPTYPANSYTSNGSGLGAYTSIITGLIQNTVYHVRAYAGNGTGTGYGADIQFRTPRLETTVVSNITETTADSGGVINFSATTTVTNRGICWNTSTNPTIANNHFSVGSGDGTFSATLTGLSQNNTYYVRAFAINSIGTSYGNQQTFSIIITAPRLTGGTDTHLFPLIGWSGKTQQSTWTGATSQRWYHKISTDPTYTLVKTTVLPSGNTTNYLALKPNVSYSFYSTFYKTGTESPASNVVTINNSVSPPTVTYSSILIV